MAIAVEALLYEAKWTDALKDAYYKTHPENFAGPHKSYPIKDASDVGDAWNLAGHADDPDAVRAKIKEIADRLGLTHGLPDTAKDDEKQESAAASVADSLIRPRKKIATLKVCFLEDNARSLNGRIYPKATVDRIVASAIKKLADPGALPVTCFVSHETANSNANTELVGRVTRVWREGSKIYALIDLADTRVARDMLALAEGGYLLSESMRVLGVELVHDRNYDLPLVMPQEGVEPELLGIDLTTRPGLVDSARIQQVLYESSQAAPYTEAFAVDGVHITDKEAPVSIPLYLKILTETETVAAEGMTTDRKAHQRIHDHLAGVMDDAIKPMHGQESAALIASAALSEEGRAIAKKHAMRLSDAHDEAARALGMECEGCYKEALGIPLDPDQDGDVDAELVIPDDDGDESARKGQKTMNEEQMLVALNAHGYKVEAPKSIEEQLAELRAQTEAQQREIEALRVAPPQRQTLAAPSAMTEGGELQPEDLYEEGEYLAGPLRPGNWRALADRRVPWPAGVDPNVALNELAPFLAYRLLENEANAMGREVSSYVGPYERI